jgi:predicted restriction endonuclease
VTGLSVPSLLRASHIKPWARCESDEERLNVFNGLLLAPNLDALFDDGWVTFRESGAIAVSSNLPASARQVLNLSDDLQIVRLTSTHEWFMRFHRAEVFRG